MLHNVLVQLLIFPVLPQRLQVDGGELPPVIDQFFLVGGGFDVFGNVPALRFAPGGQFLLVFFYQGRVGAGGAVGFATKQPYQEFGQGVCRCGGFGADHQVLQVLRNAPFAGRFLEE